MSCSEDTCPMESNTPIHFDELVENDGDQFCFLQSSIENYVIRSQSEFETLIGCIQPQNIDFNSFTLLAGGKEIPTSGRVSSQSVEQDCKSSIIFRVNIQEGNGQGFSTVYFFAVIPKIESDIPVIFKVKYDG